MVWQNIPVNRCVYFIRALNHPKIMTEILETPAGTTSANCTALLLRQNVKSQSTFQKRVVGRLFSEDLASPGADNLVQRLTERIMNPRVGGGPQAIKVHRTNCLSFTDFEVTPVRWNFLLPGYPCSSAPYPGLPRRSGQPLWKAPCDGATSSQLSQVSKYQ